MGNLCRHWQLLQGWPNQITGHMTWMFVSCCSVDWIRHVHCCTITIIVSTSYKMVYINSIQFDSVQFDMMIQPCMFSAWLGCLYICNICTACLILLKVTVCLLLGLLCVRSTLYCILACSQLFSSNPSEVYWSTRLKEDLYERSTILS